MPSTYTHYRFGKDVFARMESVVIKHMIKENWDLFLIGLHGPDILFYYDALRRNRVNAVGYGLHGRPAKEFFEHAAQIIQTAQKQTVKEQESEEQESEEQSSNERDAMIAYALGYVCHFTLDSACHSYIECVIGATDLKHTEIETDFERECMIMDDIHPRTYNAASHLKPSPYRAAVVARFYEGISKEEVEKSLEQMYQCNQLLLPTNGIKKKLIQLILKISGNYPEMHGLIMSDQPDGRCMESTRELQKRYAMAIPMANSLMINFYEYVRGREVLLPRFERTFGADETEMKIIAEVAVNV